MDNIIIKQDGLPLTLENGILPSKRGEIIVYADKMDAESDMMESDMGLLQTEYAMVGNSRERVTLYWAGNEIGEFTCKTDDRFDFQEKLWDWVVLYDFLSHQLPH